MEQIVGLKELREHMGRYAEAVKRGKSFLVIRKSKPLFKITPVEDDGQWEAMADFTKIKKGGINLKDLLARL